MLVYVQKWGNSLGMRIPANIAHRLNIKQGGVVEILVEDDHIVITPQKYNLNDLIDKMSQENLHNNLLEGSIEGSEEW